MRSARVPTRRTPTGICLPSGSNLSTEQQDRVIAHLRLVLKKDEVNRALV